jgi:DNA-binding NtrC family response regulator
MCALVSEVLEPECTCSSQSNATGALATLRAQPVDVVLTDLNMPDVGGLELCRHVAEGHPDVPVIVLTAYGSMDSAVGAIRSGAYDFITKPVDPRSLRIAVQRAAKHRALEQEVRRLREAGAEVESATDMIGESPLMERVETLITRVADTDASVLITGESGTGKELVARALHRRGGRSDRPFVALNCAAVPENLLESELFGHAKGAFTDARSSRKGLFQQADGGTLFLDEIGELPLTMQPKLLRVLQQKSVRPVGGTAPADVDVRIIAATNKDLETEVDERRFREDLFYRINVVHIDVPPLRSRGTDVMLLAQFFLGRAAERAGKQVTGIHPKAAEKLLAYDWPGNVRELENAMERAVALTFYAEITVDDLPKRVRSFRSSEIVLGGANPEEFISMPELEQRYMTRVLSAVGGNKTQAARILGFDRRTLYRKLERYGMSA